MAIEPTELKKSEQAPEMPSERFLLQSLLLNIPDHIYFKDRESRFTMVNPAAAQKFGFKSPEEVIGKTDLDIFTAEHACLAFADELEIMRTGRPVVAREEKETWPDGTVSWVTTTKLPLRNEAGEIVGTFGISRDITARKNAEEALRVSEEQLRQAQKMKVVGEVAGGVAVDFNQLLTVIMSCADQLTGNLDPTSREYGWANEVKQASLRATSLARQVLAYSHQQISLSTHVNLNAVVTDMHSLMQGLISEKIILATNLEPNLERVDLSPASIEQMLLNLVVNARDAMPNGGRLEIATSNFWHPGAKIKDLPVGDYVVLRVTDNGCGMDGAVRAHLFEPFFTTKGPAIGAGLGLSSAHDIVIHAGGTITVESEPGHGTSFQIYLPKAGEDVVPRLAPA